MYTHLREIYKKSRVSKTRILAYFMQILVEDASLVYPFSAFRAMKMNIPTTFLTKLFLPPLSSLVLKQNFIFSPFSNH